MSSTKATTPAAVRRCPADHDVGSATSAAPPARAKSSDRNMSPPLAGRISAPQCSAAKSPSAAKAPSRTRSGCARAGGWVTAIGARGSVAAAIRRPPPRGGCR